MKVCRLGLHDVLKPDPLRPCLAESDLRAALTSISGSLYISKGAIEDFVSRKGYARPPSFAEPGARRKGATMRAAIIGTGGIAEIHARAIRLLGGEVVGACGRSKASAVAFGAGSAYGDVQELLDREKPDVVHVCSPNYLHKEHVLAAFAAGTHVVCEKPVATSIADAEAMIEASWRAGKVGAAMYHNRGYPLVQLMKERIASGEVGRLL